MADEQTSPPEAAASHAGPLEAALAAEGVSMPAGLTLWLPDSDAPAATQDEAQPPPQEPPPPLDAPPVPQEAQADDPYARTRAELERRDRELLQRQAEVRAYQRQIDEYRSLRETAVSDPVAAMRLLGVDPVSAAAQYLEGPKPPDPVKQYESLAQQVQQLQAQLQERDRQAAVQAEVGRLGAVALQMAEHAPVVHALMQEQPGFAQQLFDRAVQHYQRTGQPPDYQDLVREAETEYTNNILASISGLRGVPSLRERLVQALTSEAPQKIQAPQKTAAPGAGAQEQQQTKPHNGTLSPAAMSGAPKVETRGMTDEEAEAAALKALRGGWVQD